ncbi:MAG: hypothetical protein ACREMY_04490, partial [bacterium]
MWFDWNQDQIETKSTPLILPTVVAVASPMRPSPESEPGGRQISSPVRERWENVCDQLRIAPCQGRP